MKSIAQRRNNVWEERCICTVALSVSTRFSSRCTVHSKSIVCVPCNRPCFPHIRHKAGTTVECLPRRNDRFPAPASSSQDSHWRLSDEQSLLHFVRNYLAKIRLHVSFARPSPGNLQDNLFLCPANNSLLAFSPHLTPITPCGCFYNNKNCT